jgi:hypothetical protein
MAARHSPSPRPSGAARSRAYHHERFRQLHGVSYGEAMRLSRALGLGRSPAAAVRVVAGTEAGAELVRYRGNDQHRLALGEVARRAQDRRRTELDALGEVRRGHESIAAAEASYGLPPGSLRRTFGPGAAEGDPGNVGAVLNVLGRRGSVPVVVRSLEDRQLVMAHYIEVQKALDGLPNHLGDFAGRKVAGVRLETDLVRLRALSDQRPRVIEHPYPEGRR